MAGHSSANKPPEDRRRLLGSRPLKYCNACKRSLGIECFWADRRRADGLCTWCKECKATWAKTYWHQTYYPANRERLINAVIRRRRAKREGHDETEDLLLDAGAGI